MQFGLFGTAPPVGGPFACPGCVTAIPPFNPYFGTFGKVPGIPGFNATWAPMAPIPPFNPYFGGYPGICATCL